MSLNQTGAPSPASFFRALSDDTRLGMLVLLHAGELCVCDIAGALTLSQPNASQHLAVLKSAGIVRGRRQGGWTYYSLATELSPMRQAALDAVIAEHSAPSPGPSRC